MLRSFACFCILLLLIGSASALPFNPSAVKVSVSQTIIPKATQIATHLVPVSCGEGAVNCNGRCTDINFDEMNCGSCGMTCFDPAVCCNGECVDIRVDEMNCGSCGMTCFLPAKCCMGRCEETCINVAEVVTPPKNVAEVMTPPKNVAGVVTPPVNVAEVVTPPGRPVVQGISGAIVSLTGTPHPLQYRNMTPATPVPQSCPTSEWSCMPLAQAAAQFGYPYAQYGTVPCGYIPNGGQTIAEYCCRDVPGGSVSPVSLAAVGVQKTDPGLHIINRTRLNVTNESGPAKVYGKVIEPRADFISAIFGLFSGFFSKPVPCMEGAVNCNGKCSDISFDEINCGTCGMTCFDPAVCCGGECVDMETDEMNCGTCGMTCFEPAICCRGSCEDTCGDIAEMELVTPEPAEMELVTPEAAGMVLVTPKSAEMALVETP